MCAATLAVLASGCSTVVRENIVASVDTGLGATVAENPKTEMYEAKVGFIRTQFYSVPTGKVVKNEKKKYANGEDEKDMRTNAANLTPEVVSGIRMSTSAKHLFLGADVSENFAVGTAAVNSKAAIAMYIAEADSDAKAASAGNAVAGTTVPTATVITNATTLDLQKKAADKLAVVENDSEKDKKLSALNDWMKANYKDWYEKNASTQNSNDGKAAMFINVPPEPADKSLQAFLDQLNK